MNGADVTRSRRHRRFDHAFITGGSRGLGLELSRELGRRGVRVGFCSRDPEEVERARADLRTHDVVNEGFVADVTDRPQLEAALAATQERFGPIDLLVNNAGVMDVGPPDEMVRDDYRRAMETHFWAPLEAVEAVLPQMRARGRGNIVNVASVGGRISVPHLLPYSASKFALVGYSEGLRAELLAEGIFVTTAVPGLMRTGSQENATFKGEHRAEYAWFSTLGSLPFISVDVTEAARAIVDAAENGDADITISIPARVGSALHGIFPGFISDALGIVARLLPASTGQHQPARRGSESHSALAPSPLTSATQQRAETQNEVSS